MVLEGGMGAGGGTCQLADVSVAREEVSQGWAELEHVSSSPSNVIAF